MKFKLYLVFALFASLVGYLEWGNNNAFIYEIEFLFFSKIFTNPISVIHPFTVIPLIGQILLIILIFKNKPNKPLTIIALTSIAILFLMILLTGILSQNLKIVISVVPYFVFCILVFLLIFKKLK
ncbi:MAG: hypothetical protein HUU47_01365 [Bacteroidetes bacterium]|nr:hypothetical protein [Bacteroidota bacterium]